MQLNRTVFCYAKKWLKAEIIAFSHLKSYTVVYCNVLNLLTLNILVRTEITTINKIYFASIF